MQRNRYLLVFQLHSRKPCRQCLGRLPHFFLLLGRYRDPAKAAVGAAKLQSMQAGGGPVWLVEESVQIIQITAADQRKGAVHRIMQRVKQGKQRLADVHGARVIVEIQQGAIDVQEKRPVRACGGQWRGWKRVLGQVGVGIFHVHRGHVSKADVKDIFDRPQQWAPRAMEMILIHPTPSASFTQWQAG